MPTVLGLARRGYFIPARYAGAMPASGSLPPYEPLETVLAGSAATFERWLARIDDHAVALGAIGSDAPPAPRWDQDWFPRMDAAIAYAIARAEKPARIVEIGCGHSTRFFARAVADEGLATAITAIDPAPRADLAGLPQVTLVRAALHETDLAAFAELTAGDILAIDSSHILMPGTDVDVLLNRILPTLPAGVLVHVHDVFLPDDYPADWAWRGYNEQQGVAPLLVGGGWRIEFASHYVATRMARQAGATVLGRLPLRDGAHEASLWLRKGL